MPPTGKPAVSSDRLLVLRYAGAAMAALAALGVRMALDPMLGAQAPYLPFIIAIVVASRYGGRGPGLAAAAISTAAVDWFYLEPRNSWAIMGPNAAAGLALFFLTGAIISFFMGRLRQFLLSAAREEPAPGQTEEQSSLWPGWAMASRGPGRKLKPHYLWLGAAVLLLAIEALLFWGTWTRFAERESLSVRAREVLAKIESLLSELKDAETGQRGYLLTGQDSYLEPYNAAVQAIPGQLDDLRKLTLDPGQQARTVSLRPLIAAKLAEVKKTIDLRQTGATAAALQVLSSHRGKQLMDEIRNRVAAMRAAEASLLEERSQRAAAAARGMGFVMASGAGLLLIVLLAGSREIDRNLTRRQRAQEELGESEERYRTLFNTLIEGFCIIEVIFDAESRPIDYRFLEINAAFEGQTGLKNARGRLMRELAPEHEAHWFEIYGKVALSGQPASFVNEARALGRWYEVNAYRVGDPESRRVAILFNDISERKRAEEKIRASEEKFAKAFATNPAALAITRIEDGFTIEVNETWQAMMGHSRDEAIGRSTFDLHTWPAAEDRARYAKDLREKGSISGREVTLLRKSGEPFTALMSAVILPIAGEDLILSAWLDISDRKKGEFERETAAEFLQLVNASTSTVDLIRAATAFFQTKSGCEAVGIRLKKGEDYPYYEARGFPPEFVQMENSLCARNDAGEAIRNSAGYPVLECMCGSVICGRFDPAKQFFTNGGSFWTNSTTELLAGTTEADRQSGTRNRCNGQGYESVALIPVRSGAEALGLLQLNDQRTGMFSPEAIALWERLADYLAAALTKIRAEEALRESEAQFRTLANAIPQLCWMANADGGIFWYNERWYEYTGTTPEQMEGWGWQSVHDPEALPEVLERWKVSLANAEPFEMVFPLRGADGVLRPFLTRVMPVRGEDGKVARWFGTNTDISGQRKIEEALRESEEQFRSVAENMSEGLMLLDARGNLTYQNPASLRIHGFGTPGAGHVEQENLPATWKGWDETGRPMSFEEWPISRVFRGERFQDQILHVMRVETGQEFYASYNGCPIIDANGRLSLGFITIREITGQRKAEMAVRESEDRYRNLFESMDEGFAECEMIYDAAGRPIDFRYLAVNPAFGKATGLMMGEMVGRTVREVIPGIEPFWMETYGRIVRTGESERIANPVAALGKHFEVFAWRSGPGRFAVVFSDVTERKRAEEALVRMSAMVESSDDAIIGKTLEGAITSWNLGATLLYGYSAPEAIGRHISALVPAGHPDEITTILRRLANGERVEQFEAVRRRKDGSLVDVSLKISPILDASGQVVGASTIARDITERKRAEEEIRRLNADLEDRVRRRTAQLEAANKELEAFAYSVSHDLRAPLRGIDGWSLALVEDYASQLDERAHGYVDRVRAETQRMGTLIDDMLQLSRVTRSEMATGVVDLTRIAQTIAARLAEANCGRRIEFAIAGGLGANGDARLLAIALENLFGNAVKFTGPRAEGRIEFGRTEGDGESPFYVRDNGVGFDMAFAGTLFGAFQRLHKTSEFPGSGVGLATVQRIIHRHGGRVWAEAQPDRGATFYFTLGGS